jgi:hypothetical protein
VPTDTDPARGPQAFAALTASANVGGHTTKTGRLASEVLHGPASLASGRGMSGTSSTCPSVPQSDTGDVSGCEPSGAEEGEDAEEHAAMHIAAPAKRHLESQDD